MVMKFRMVKFARIPSYNQLFTGDPAVGHRSSAASVWTAVAWLPRMTTAILHTLENMGPAPSPT